jgi:hypothetical protein
MDTAVLRTESLFAAPPGDVGAHRRAPSRLHRAGVMLNSGHGFAAGFGARYWLLDTSFDLPSMATLWF